MIPLQGYFSLNINVGFIFGRPNLVCIVILLKKGACDCEVRCCSIATKGVLTIVKTFSFIKEDLFQAEPAPSRQISFLRHSTLEASTVVFNNKFQRRRIKTEEKAKVVAAA